MSTPGGGRGPFDLIGHQRELDQLRGLWRDGAGPRTLLFAGPEAVGRRPAARWLAAYVNCLALVENRPCGVCASCLAVANHTHVDVREVAPSATTRTGRSKHVREITIDQLVPREGGDPEPLSEWLRSRPRSAYRVGIIDQAESMTAGAANSFLKMLEAPPRQALIILIAPGPDAVLPTVASRATVVRFGAVAVSGFDDLGPHPAVRLGQPGALLRARASEEDSASARDCALAFLTALTGDLRTALSAADDLSAGITAALEAGVDPGPLGWLREPLRGLMETPPPTERAAAGGTDLAGQEAVGHYVIGPEAVGPATYAAALEEVERCEDALASYASGPLACAVLALRLRRVLAVGT